jgi:Carboxypeptidase regulatory-like domain
MWSVSRFLICGLWFATAALAQDTATGEIRGTVGDSAGGRIGACSVVLVNAATNFRYSTTTDGFGRFAFELLPPGETTRPAPNRRECRRRPRQACMWM